MIMTRALPPLSCPSRDEGSHRWPPAEHGHGKPPEPVVMRSSTIAHQVIFSRAESAI
jgi:hypothetical protein